jgi:hypothetical protein
MLFTVLVFGAVLLGAGALFSPALPTTQPRVGLAAAFTLALIIGGALFWLNLFGGELIVIDYVLFGLLSGIVLGGTLSQSQMRAEAQGVEFVDADQGWTGPQDLVFFALVGVFFILLAVRLMPIVQDGVFSPGIELLTTYLSQQLDQPRPAIQMGLSTVFAFLGVWIAYDLGSELLRKALGRTMAVALLGTGLWLALYLNGSISALLGLLFIVAYWLFVLRLWRTARWQAILGAGLMLGAALYVSFPILALALLSTPLWLAFLMLYDAAPPTSLFQRLGSLAVLPIIAGLATLPWLQQHWGALGGQWGNNLPIALMNWVAAAIFAMLLGGFALLWLWQKVPLTVQQQLRQRYYLAAGIGGVLLVLAGWLLP